MTTALSAGANAPLPSAQTITVGLQAASGHADLIALLLDGAGRADGDNGVVLFSQPVSAGGAVQLDLATDTVTVSLPALPVAVERVLVVAQADGTPDVAPCGTLTATVSADGSAVASAAFSALPAVATLQLVELYRRAGGWKVRALGDGYADGLAKLLAVHGVDVTDEPADGPAASSPPAVQTPPAPAAPHSFDRPDRAPAPAAPAAAPTPATEPSAPQAPAAPPNLKKAEGKLSLKKGQKPVLMTKTERITATVSWKSGTDYDVYALVLMRDGSAVDVAAFEAEGVPVRLEHAGVRHLGDVKAEATDTRSDRVSDGGGSGWRARLRGGGGGDDAGVPEVHETIEIRLTPDVLAVVPVAYSAINNGGGSFKHYDVSLAIDNGSGTRITIPSVDANDNPGVYTCVPGLIRNSADGVVIEPLELYSKSGSERRPVVSLKGAEVVVTMDAGAENLPKDD